MILFRLRQTDTVEKGEIVGVHKQFDYMVKMKNGSVLAIWKDEILGFKEYLKLL